MRSRGISYTTGNVRAIAADRKTQTRRIIDPQPDPRADWIKPDLNDIWRAGTAIGEVPQFGHWIFPYGKIGGLLHVREHTWMFCEKLPDGVTKKGNPKFRYVALDGAMIFYCADREHKPWGIIPHPGNGNEWLWRKKLARYMPRHASRTTLEITGIRAERLQDISEADAIAEGIERVNQLGILHPTGWRDYSRNTAGVMDPVQSYRTLWESINGPGSWDANPWVWVITFKKLNSTAK